MFGSLKRRSNVQDTTVLGELGNGRTIYGVTIYRGKGFYPIYDLEYVDFRLVLLSCSAVLSAVLFCCPVSRPASISCLPVSC